MGAFLKVLWFLLKCFGFFALICACLVVTMTIYDKAGWNGIMVGMGVLLMLRLNQIHDIMEKQLKVLEEMKTRPNT